MASDDESHHGGDDVGTAVAAALAMQRQKRRSLSGSAGGGGGLPPPIGGREGRTGDRHAKEAAASATTINATVRGRKTGLVLRPLGAIETDDDGFETIDAFWDGAATAAAAAAANGNGADEDGKAKKKSSKLKKKAKDDDAAAKKKKKERDASKRAAATGSAARPQFDYLPTPRASTTMGDEEDEENANPQQQQKRRSDTKDGGDKTNVDKTPRPSSWHDALLPGRTTGAAASSPGELSRVSTAPPSTISVPASRRRSTSSLLATTSGKKAGSGDGNRSLGSVAEEHVSRWATGVPSPPAAAADDDAVAETSPKTSSSSRDDGESGEGDEEEEEPAAAEVETTMETTIDYDATTELDKLINDRKKAEEEEAAKDKGEDASDDDDDEEEEELFPAGEGEEDDDDEVDFGRGEGLGTQEEVAEEEEEVGRAALEPQGRYSTGEVKRKSLTSPSPPPLDKSMEDLLANNEGYNDDDGDDEDKDGPGFQMAAVDDDDDEEGVGVDDEEDEEAAHASLLQRSVPEEHDDLNRSRRKEREEDDDRMDVDDDDEEQENEEERRQRKKKERKDRDKKSKKKKQKKKTYASDEDSSVVTPIDKKKKTKRGNNKKGAPKVTFVTPRGISSGMPTANRDYEAVPVSDYKEDGSSPDTPSRRPRRRSRRARFPPLQFWKNERLLYEAQREDGWLGEAMGDMPVVSGVLQALPTPYKERTNSNGGGGGGRKGNKGGNKRKKSSDDSSTAVPAHMEPFDSRKLRKKHTILDGEVAYVWDEPSQRVTERKVVSYADNMVGSTLPLSSKRSKKESRVVGTAAQAFNVPGSDDVIENDENSQGGMSSQGGGAGPVFPGWIAGNLVLPPRGIKDAEGVGLCSQVFNVGTDTQPQSLEVSLADPDEDEGRYDGKTAQRFLLGPGDMFHVPPGNVYRIENHSRVGRCTLYWTIIKPNGTARGSSMSSS